VVRDRLSEIVDPAGLEQTPSVLGESAALPDVREADVAYTSGEVGCGVDALHALRP
jgi:hypothetical protein